MPRLAPRAARTRARAALAEILVPSVAARKRARSRSVASPRPKKHARRASPSPKRAASPKRRASPSPKRGRIAGGSLFGMFGGGKTASQRAYESIKARYVSADNAWSNLRSAGGSQAAKRKAVNDIQQIRQKIFTVAQDVLNDPKVDDGYKQEVSRILAQQHQFYDRAQGFLDAGVNL